MGRMVLAAFDSREHAAAAVDRLEANGYNPQDLSVITKDRETTADRTDRDAYGRNDFGERVGGGATAGAVTGGAVGGLAGLLAGVGVFPALAGLFIGGPLAAALGLTGAAAATVSGAATGALAGGLIGALTGLGLSEDEARHYDTTVREGGIIIGVPIREDTDEHPRSLLETLGATRINEVETRA